MYDDNLDGGKGSLPPLEERVCVKIEIGLQNVKCKIETYVKRTILGFFHEDLMFLPQPNEHVSPGRQPQTLTLRKQVTRCTRSPSDSKL